MNTFEHASRRMLLLAFLAIYVSWGSTYLAIRFAIETMPPFTMAGARFLIAGGVLYAFLRLRGEGRPRAGHWLSAAVVGALLLGVGNGGVTWAEQRIPSGVAALLVAGTPAWMVLFDWLRPAGRRPSWLVGAGLALGVAGIFLLVGPGDLVGSARTDLAGAAAVLVGSMAWAFGSIVSRSLRHPSSVFLATAMQMIVAGVLLTAVGGGAGEWGTVDWGGISRTSALAFLYLIVFGSWIGFGAYVYLLRVTSAARASTYAYVNPVVAVLLGWSLAGEVLDLRMVAAMVVIVAGVALITLGSGSGSRGSAVVRREAPEVAVSTGTRRRDQTAHRGEKPERSGGRRMDRRGAGGKGRRLEGREAPDRGPSHPQRV
jgi:drug/metabolite transporter (DMT)-like permease